MSEKCHASPSSLKPWPLTSTGSVWFTIVFILVSTVSMANAISSLLEVYVQGREGAMQEGILQMQNLTKGKLEDMDLDSDGRVSRAEYTLYMCLKMDLVDQVTVDRYYKKFKKLDKNGNGWLSHGDVPQLGRNKAQS